MRKENVDGSTVTPPSPPRAGIKTAGFKMRICGDSKGVGSTGPGNCGGYILDCMFPSKVQEAICWSLKKLNIPRYWKKTKGKGIKVAVLDTGIAYGHPDFCGKYPKRSKCEKWENSSKKGPKACGGCEYNAIVDCKDFTDSKYGTDDRDGHGTHVAGIIAARKNASGVVGVAPKAKLLIGKVLGDDRTGTYEQLAEGIKWAVKNKADIISMSVQSIKVEEEDDVSTKKDDVSTKKDDVSTKKDDVSIEDGPVHEAIEEAAKKGVILICAAGNSTRVEENAGEIIEKATAGGDTESPETVKYPARHPHVLSVGAIDREGKVPDFSCRGETLDQIDIVAPGDKILSCYPPDRSAVLSGTSMAAPFVSGVVALILSDKENNTPKDREGIIEQLRSGAIDVGETGRDAASGFGLINPGKLLQLKGKKIRYKAGKYELPLKILMISLSVILAALIVYLLFKNVF